jgi:hypothetical protein
LLLGLRLTEPKGAQIRPKPALAHAALVLTAADQDSATPIPNSPKRVIELAALALAASLVVIARPRRWMSVVAAPAARLQAQLLRVQPRRGPPLPA